MFWSYKFLNFLCHFERQLRAKCQPRCRVPTLGLFLKILYSTGKPPQPALDTHGLHWRLNLLRVVPDMVFRLLLLFACLLNKKL